MDAIYRCAHLYIGFAIHRTEEGGFGYKSLAGIFTAELTALFVILRYIGKVIQPLVD
jgi:hypothetical protein